MFTENTSMNALVFVKAKRRHLVHSPGFLVVMEASEEP